MTGRPERITVVIRRITFGDGVGGLERAAADHVVQMLGAGLEVDLVCPAVEGGVVPAGVNVVEIPWPQVRLPFGLRYALWCRRVAKYLHSRMNAGQLVHFHGASVGALRFLRSESRSQQNYVVNPHGMEEFAPRRSWVPRPRPMQWLAKSGSRAAAVIATDFGMVPDVVRNIRVDPKRVVVIPNAVDTSLYEANRDRQNGRSTVLTVGRLVRTKGYDILARALASEAVAARLPQDWVWTHYGSGPEEASLKELARTLELPLRMVAGASDEAVRNAYGACQVFVQPSIAEGSSLTTIEAMASGAVVVVTPVGGMPDKVRHGVTGFVSDEVSSAALGRAVLEALAADSELGLRAQLEARERFDLKVVATQYLRLYADIRAGRYAE